MHDVLKLDFSDGKKKTTFHATNLIKNSINIITSTVIGGIQY